MATSNILMHWMCLALAAGTSVIAGCDLFPETPPPVQAHDSGAEAAGGAGSGGTFEGAGGTGFGGATGMGGTAMGGAGGAAGATAAGGAGAAGVDGGAGAAGVDGGAGAAGVDGGAGAAGVGGGAGAAGVDGGAGAAGVGGGAGAAGVGGAATTEVVAPVADGSDDVNEDHKSYEATNSTAWIGTGHFKNNSWASFRFHSVPVPQGASVEEARLELFAPDASSIRIDLTLNAVATDDCAPFSINDPPSSRALTATKVDHGFDTRWSGGTWIQLADIAPVVEEVVKRPGWQDGGSLCIVIQGHGAAEARRFVRSRDGSATEAPRLRITYTTE